MRLGAARISVSLSYADFGGVDTPSPDLSDSSPDRRVLAPSVDAGPDILVRCTLRATLGA